MMDVLLPPPLLLLLLLLLLLVVVFQDALTGATNWAFNTSGEVESHPAFQDGQLCSPCAVLAPRISAW